MRRSGWKAIELQRKLGAALALSMMVLLSACGGGSHSDPSPQQASDTSDAAAQIAAPGGDAGLAVQAARSMERRGDANGIREVVVFGDSLSDVGTYKAGTIAALGGGKFTTNPGPVWPETIGLLFGARVTPFRMGFGGQSQIVGGTGYAMGGARVAQQPGIGCSADANGACTAALTIPVTQQIGDYLSAHNDRFTGDQLVFVLAGANDIFYQLGVFEAKVKAEVPAKQAQDEAITAVQQAAVELVAQVRRVIDKGGARVVVLNVPEMSATPFGKSVDEQIRPLIAGMVETFNGTLTAGLNGTSAVLLDLRGEFLRVLENPGAFFVREINVPACDAAKIASITQGAEQDGSSLFCSRQTLVQDGAAVAYFFADGVHPTTLGHLILARFVLVQLWKQGLL